ncbi:hypothetical protein O181_008584 [Austropuccinia psidii MF-1]|uniref:Uncharacterized protein n=1 Tax=Austropuccinia psidii MF-1 TaxID=1389203 RepID=A0A9Q3BMT7_9BASI|nr:hypothetical protein [Austropuccinia psidii MF-1]
MSPEHLWNGYRTDKDCLEPEGQGLDTLLDGRRLREFIPTLPFTLQFNKSLKPEDWKDMDHILQLHKILIDLLQWRMGDRRFNLDLHWEKL